MVNQWQKDNDLANDLNMVRHLVSCIGVYVKYNWVVVDLHEL